MKLSTFMSGAVLMGTLLVSGVAFGDRPEDAVLETKEAAAGAVEDARERSNAQWKDDAQRGRDRVETVQEEGKQKAYGHSKDKHKDTDKHKGKLKDKEKKWKDKSAHERSELEGDERRMKDRGKEMGDDAAREADEAKRKMSESVNKQKEAASAEGENAKEAVEAISNQAKASPKGEARGFWARIFGSGGDSE